LLGVVEPLADVWEAERAVLLPVLVSQPPQSISSYGYALLTAAAPSLCHQLVGNLAKLTSNLIQEIVNTSIAEITFMAVFVLPESVNIYII
jgi:hypothetical protein